MIQYNDITKGDQLKPLPGLNKINSKLQINNSQLSDETSENNELNRLARSLERKQRISQLHTEEASKTRGYKDIEGVQRRGIREEIGNTPGFGTSDYDKEITSMSQLKDLPEHRARSQSGSMQLINALGKTAVTAGATFVNSTLGLVSGLGNLTQGKSYWDNDINKFSDNLMKWSEEAMPNYYTNEENNKEWYQRIFTPNFIGNEVLKNMGFSIGAAAAGIITGGGVAAGLGKLLSGVKLGSVTTRLAAGGVMAAGEASTEAINTANDFTTMNEQMINSNFELNIKSLEDSTSKRFQEIQGRRDVLIPIKNNEGKVIEHKSLNQLELEQLKKEYDISLQNIYNEKDDNLSKVKELSTKAGNAVMAANMPVLMASNIIQFGNVLMGGYKNAKRAQGISKSLKSTGATISGAKEGADAILSNDLLVEAKKGFGKMVTKKALLNSMSEGTEEAIQNLASNSAQLKYSSDLNSFAGYKLNPYVNQEVDDWMSSMSQAMGEQFGDMGAQGVQEFFMGFFTGATGIPTYGKRKSGKKGVILSGGIKEAIDETKDQFKSNDYVDAVNSRLSDPKFLALHEGIRGHIATENLMDHFVQEGNQWAYKNTEEAQIVNDMLLFRNAGMLDDYLGFLKNYTTVSQEDVDGIKHATKSEKDGVSLKEGRSSDEISKEVSSRAKRYHDDANKIIDIYDNLLVRFGDERSKESIEELTYKMYKLNSSKERFNDIYKKDIISNIIPIIESLADKTIDVDGETFNIKDLALDNPSLFLNQLVTGGTDINEKIYNIAKNNSDRYETALKELELLKSEDIESGKKSTDSETLAKIKALKLIIKEAKRKNLITDPEKLKESIEDGIVLSMMSKVFSVEISKSLIDPNYLQNKIDNDVSNLQEIEKEKELNEDDNLLDTAKDISELKEFSNEISESNKIEALNRYVERKKESELGDQAKELLEMQKNAKALLSLVNIDDFNEYPDEDKADVIDSINSGLSKFNNSQDFLDYLYNRAMENPALDKALEILIESKNTESSVESESKVSKTPIGNNPDDKKTQEKIIKSTDTDTNTNSDKAIINSNIDEFEIDPTITDSLSPEKSLSDTSIIIGNDNSVLNSTDAITEASIDELKDNGMYVSFGRKNTKYSTIWNKYSSRGIFNFINSGKLAKLFNKNNDLDVYFIVDKKFNNSDPLFDKVVFTAVKAKTNTSIEINGEHYQLIGTIKNNTEETNFIINESITRSNEDQSSDFVISGIKSKIEKITPGRMVLETESIPKGERDVDVENPILGVQTNSGFTVPALRKEAYLSPKDKKAGAVYLMVPMANGKYIPTQVIVKKFNDKEYNIQEHRGSKIYEKIYRAVEGILKNALGEQTPNTVQQYRTLLESVLYFGKTIAIGEEKGQEFSLHYSKNSNTGQVFISYGRLTGIDENGNKKYQTISSIDVNSVSDLPNVINFIQKLNPRFQIDFRRLDDPSYSKELVDSKVMTTNLAVQDEFRNATVILKLKGNNLKTNPPKGNAPYIKGSERDHVIVIVHGTPFKYYNDDKVFNPHGTEVTDKNLLAKIFAKKIIVEKKESLEFVKLKDKYIYKIPKGNTYYAVSVGLVDDNVKEVLTKNQFDELERSYKESINPTSNEININVDSVKKETEIKDTGLDPFEVFVENGFDFNVHGVEINGFELFIIDIVTKDPIEIYPNLSDENKNTITKYNEDIKKALENKDVKLASIISNKIKILISNIYKVDSVSQEELPNNNDSVLKQKQKPSTNKTNLIRDAIAGTISNTNELENSLENSNNSSIFDNITRDQQKKLRETLREKGIEVNSMSEIIEKINEYFKKDGISINSFPSIDDIINKIKCK